MKNELPRVNVDRPWTKSDTKALLWWLASGLLFLLILGGGL